ncbi:MAG: glucose-1-phosphate adenylyltransferase [bacterium]
MANAPPPQADDLKVIVMILAGGQGERLYPLTRDRAKPAVPFGGIFRIIDFTLSNCINSGLRRVFVLTQYKSSSLDYHIHFGWNILSPALGEFILTVPPQQRITRSWYLGTADAIYQNIYTLERERPDLVLILSGDHIYKMNYQTMVDFHREKQADLTIACVPVPRRDAARLGVAVVDEEHRIVDFQEKHPEPATIPGSDGWCLASMGVYLFDTRTLVRQVAADAKTDSEHDFGKNIIPRMIRSHRVFAHDFDDMNRKPEKYWRDIGTRDSYWQANMDLVAIDPLFNLYDYQWPIRTFPLHYPPAKTVTVHDGTSYREARALDSLLSNGCIVSGACVERSVLSPNVHVLSGAQVSESVIMEGTTVGHNAVVRRAIIDKGVRVPDGATIGVDPESDARQYVITTQGVVVVPRELHYS